MPLPSPAHRHQSLPSGCDGELALLLATVRAAALCWAPDLQLPAPTLRRGPSPSANQLPTKPPPSRTAPHPPCSAHSPQPKRRAQLGFWGSGVQGRMFGLKPSAACGAHSAPPSARGQLKPSPSHWLLKFLAITLRRSPSNCSASPDIFCPSPHCSYG